MSRPRKKRTLAEEVEVVAVLIQKVRRLEEADEFGFVVCVTCGKRRRWNDNMDGGHLISRNNKSTKLIEWQIWPQCKGCNKWKMKDSAYVLRFRNHVVSVKGEAKVAWLERQARKSCKYNRGELEILRIDLNKRISVLEKQYEG